MKLVLATLLIALLGAGVHCMAGEEELDIDTRFRAKIAKEKVKEGALQRRLDALGRDTADRSADAACAKPAGTAQVRVARKRYWLSCKSPSVVKM